MNTTTTRFLGRLPQLITFFFSLTLVNGFRVLSDTYHWTTQPSFKFNDPGQYLIAVSFVVTLVWIVTAWLGYSLLIERVPYTLGFGRFFFDVARFSLMFALLNFTFLAGQKNGYQIYLFTLAIFHFMMVAWYFDQERQTTDATRQKMYGGDVRSHGFRALTYLVLGLVFYFGVATRSTGTGTDSLRYAILIVTFVLMTVWNVRRLADLRAYARGEDAPATVEPAPAVAEPGDGVPVARA
ncbi:MAG TPA: hypothetical protein VKU87_00745 [Thermomicrobiaceae bacterium]|nr:hypothetical protein [Thermomicrobiaceae bacterium]